MTWQRMAVDELLIVVVCLLVGLGTAVFFRSAEAGILLVMVVAIATAVYSTYSGTLKFKLYSYIWQSTALVPLAVLRAFETNDQSFWFVALFLAGRVFVIPGLMTWATVGRQMTWFVALFLMARAWVGTSFYKVRVLFRPELMTRATEGRQAANEYVRSSLTARLEQIEERVARTQEYWLIYGQTRAGSVISLVASGLFIGLAFLIAMRVQLPPDLAHEAPIALGAAISLLLIGLFAMINEQELPSQIVGLLTMENGLFLAAAIFITDLSFLLSFWASMLGFFLLTFLILAAFVPRVHQVSGSAEIAAQKKLVDDPGVLAEGPESLPVSSSPLPERSAP